MIARISGNLIERRPEYCIVDVGGLGYRVFVTLNTFYALPDPGAPVTLQVHTVVRDDAIHLYGFKDRGEKETFESLISVSGVGPRLAVSILSGISPDDLWVAVTGRDAARLTKVPGVGKKTAARLVVELEGKLPQAESDAPAAAARSQAASDAVSALMNLGYPEAAAAKAVEKAVAALGAEAALEDLLRETLKSLR